VAAVDAGDVDAVDLQTVQPGGPPSARMPRPSIGVPARPLIDRRGFDLADLARCGLLPAGRIPSRNRGFCTTGKELTALDKVVIFVDEADTQFGGVGAEAHATERRLTGKLRQ
jgi:hypothetical protein